MKVNITAQIATIPPAMLAEKFANMGCRFGLCLQAYGTNPDIFSNPNISTSTNVGTRETGLANPVTEFPNLYCLFKYFSRQCYTDGVLDIRNNLRKYNIFLTI
jgi:hypothetical protein